MQATTAVGAIVCLYVMLAQNEVSGWRVDCTKFVFAPKCRGVSAKRMAPSAFHTGSRALPEASWDTSLFESDAMDPRRGEKTNVANPDLFSAALTSENSVDAPEEVETGSTVDSVSEFFNKLRKVARLEQSEALVSRDRADASRRRLVTLLRNLYADYQSSKDEKVKDESTY